MVETSIRAIFNQKGGERMFDNPNNRSDGGNDQPHQEGQKNPTNNQQNKFGNSVKRDDPPQHKKFGNGQNQ